MTSSAHSGAVDLWLVALEELLAGAGACPPTRCFRAARLRPELLQCPWRGRVLWPGGAAPLLPLLALVPHQVGSPRRGVARQVRDRGFRWPALALALPGRQGPQGRVQEAGT